ncbi:MAG: chromosomal replication initiator protein DnaA [Solirubrobacterales bacterium]|nr:chromosomal replication initiator protein DnaA [Solirubrobacterales bacterium]MBV9716920.1 chromosomal replication initiator protein DnaA [Solirubrobacterales bacterium]
MELPAHSDLTPAWPEFRARLRDAVGESTYHIWLEPLEPHRLEGGILTLRAPAATQRWVAERFGRVLEACARATLADDVRVVLADSKRGSAGEPPRGDSPAGPPELASGDLNPRYRFDQFIIGDGNRLAHAAALAVAENPGYAYNPLFLHAPPGLGKTHLLQAIGNYVRTFSDHASVRYATVESFTNQFISALSSRSIDRFKTIYRNADVLLVDDVQFLASKAKTEEEFFHTFNTLYESGRQVVLTCDRLPRQMPTVEERLRARFEAGLVADIRPPDFATRVAILRKRAALDQIEVADTAVLEWIAERVTENVRSLEGALIRLVAHHSLNRRPIDVKLAEAVLDGGSAMLSSSPSPARSIEAIQNVVASRFDLTVSELVSTSRASRVAWPRQLAMHLARKLTDASLVTIGQAFGARNHGTVLHACRRVDARISRDQQVRDDVDELAEMITGGQADRSG